MNYGVVVVIAVWAVCSAVSFWLARSEFTSREAPTWLILLLAIPFGPVTMPVWFLCKRLKRLQEQRP